MGGSTPKEVGVNGNNGKKLNVQRWVHLRYSCRWSLCCIGLPIVLLVHRWRDSQPLPNRPLPPSIFSRRQTFFFLAFLSLWQIFADEKSRFFKRQWEIAVADQGCVDLHWRVKIATTELNYCEMIAAKKWIALLTRDIIVVPPAVSGEIRPRITPSKCFEPLPC